MNQNNEKNVNNYIKKNLRIDLYKAGFYQFCNNNILEAVGYLNQFLESTARLVEVDISDLTPDLFADDKNNGAVFLLSQTFWYLARAYDLNGKNADLVQLYLDKFIQFSLDQKFQYVSWQMVKRFNKKRPAQNSNYFISAESRLKEGIDSCFIATYVLGGRDHRTSILRSLKRRIENTWAGDKFIDFYYFYSPSWVHHCARLPGQWIVKRLISLPLSILAYLVWPLVQCRSKEKKRVQIL